MTINNFKEAIYGGLPIHINNMLLRNHIYTWQRFADMSDYDLAMLKGVHHFEELLMYRDKAKQYKEFCEKRESEVSGNEYDGE